MKLMVFSIVVALAAAAAMPTDTNESDDLEFHSKSVAFEDSGEKLAPSSPPQATRRSLGQFIGSILERTPLRNWLPSRCSHHHHDHHHDHEDYDYDEHYDGDHHQYDNGHHYGHGHGHHDYNTEPTSASTSLQPTTIRNRNVEDNLTTTAVPATTSSTTTPATITSSSTARYKDPDNELTVDINLRFGEAR